MKRSTFVLIALGLLFAVFYLLKCQPRAKPNPEIEALNRVIEVQKEVIQAKEEANEDLMVVIKQGYKTDSILLSNLKANQIKYVPYQTQLKDIPGRIAAIANNDDSIRAAFAR